MSTPAPLLIWKNLLRAHASTPAHPPDLKIFFGFFQIFLPIKQEFTPLFAY